MKALGEVSSHCEIFAFCHAMFMVFNPFIYQFPCIDIWIYRIRDPSPDRLTKKPFIIGTRSIHADMTVDCEADFCKM